MQSVSNHLSKILLILTVGSVCYAQFSDLPAPPNKPDRFQSKSELRDYLRKLHDYYSVVGRPRFGKRNPLVTNGEKVPVVPAEMLITPQTLIKQLSHDMAYKSALSKYVDNEIVSSLFSYFDLNNDGLIQKNEFKKGISGAGYKIGQF
ncbi:hypothetical protein SNEBB_009263 [Seison nebaliae]|nr:hypothetical protein SNEBB_009263 [Seison nebaliae]